jgi:RNA polymerase sigma-70 factor (ECF subfamily)
MSSLSDAQFEAELPEPASGGRRDAELFRKAQLGDRPAFGQIVVLFQDRIYNAILRIVGDREEARELTQETFTRALVKIDSFRGEAGPYTWLFRIAVNLAISELRKNQRHRTLSLYQPTSTRRGSDDQASALVDRIAESHNLDPADVVENRERDQQVLSALSRLDAEYRAVLVMRDIEGFDYQQMAQVLDLPLGTLKSRLFRARLALRDELKGYLK